MVVVEVEEVVEEGQDVPMITNTVNIGPTMDTALAAVNTWRRTAGKAVTCAMAQVLCVFCGYLHSAVTYGAVFNCTKGSLRKNSFQTD